jgi:hypothetical protein
LSVLNPRLRQLFDARIDRSQKNAQIAEKLGVEGGQSATKKVGFWRQGRPTKDLWSEGFQARLEREYGIRPCELKEALDGGAHEYLRETFLWYRKHRLEVTNIARAYYYKVPGVLDRPFVTKKEWLPATPISLDEFDSRLSKPENWNDKEPDPPQRRLHFIPDETYWQFIERLATENDWKFEQEERACYRLIDVRLGGSKLELSFAPATYSQFVNSCESLGFELGEWCLRNPRKLKESQPPKTSAGLTRGRPAEIFSLKNQSACPGFSTFLLLLNQDGGDYFYLHDRSSSKVLESPGTYHVLPAGQFQPDQKDDANHNRDFSLYRSILRELAEELI